MSFLGQKIRKLQKALELKGKLYLVTRSQVYSEKLGRFCNLTRLDYLMPVDEYNERNPGKEKDPNKRKFVKVGLTSSFREVDILLKMVDIYNEKEGDESD